MTPVESKLPAPDFARNDRIASPQDCPSWPKPLSLLALPRAPFPPGPSASRSSTRSGTAASPTSSSSRPSASVSASSSPSSCSSEEHGPRLSASALVPAGPMRSATSASSRLRGI